MPIFFSMKGNTVLIKIMTKNWGHRTGFCGRAEESAHRMHFFRFLREDWGEFQNGKCVEGGRKH